VSRTSIHESISLDRGAVADDDLRAPATDVHHRSVLKVRDAADCAPVRPERFFIPGEDVDSEARGIPHEGDKLITIGGVPDRARAADNRPVGGMCVNDLPKFAQRLQHPFDCLGVQIPGRIHTLAEPGNALFIDDRCNHAASIDRGDEQQNSVGADVDRRHLHSRTSVLAARAIHSFS
jgi:hypothetical protein